MNYVETDCVIEHEGQLFEAGGAEVDENYCVAYLGKLGTLTDWHGNTIGTYTVIASWRTPKSYVSTHMLQIEAKVGGCTYTGRSAGVNMIFKGKRIAKERR